MAKLKHLTLPDGNNYDIYGVNVQEISYDDYESLTPTQKNSDIAYCITDTPYEVDDSIYGEASGAIASFADGSANPLVKLEADINPVQDLHGYDKPWAGGAGKNLFNMGSKASGTFSGLTFTSDDDCLIVNGTKYGASYYTPQELEFTLPSGTYYARSFASGTATSTPDVYVMNGGTAATGSIKTTEQSFTLEAETTLKIRFAFWTDNAQYTNYKISVVISKTSGIDSYSPYSNICPISGRSSVEVTVVGKNLYSDVFADYTKPLDYRICPIPLEIGKTYTAKAKLVGTAASGCVIGIAKKGDRYSDFGSFITLVDAGGNVYTHTITLDSAWTSPKLIVYAANETAFNSLFENYEVQLEVGSTATSYEAYNADTETISLGQTVYGGKLNVTTGELTVDRVIIEFDGDSLEDWTLYSASNVNQLYINVAGAMSSTGGKITTMCDTYKSISIDNRYNNYNTCYAGNNSICFNIADYTTATWREYLQNNPVKVVYTLSTPQTYQLTPTQVSSILGANNIWADSGDVDVVYITSDFIYNELRMNDTVIASNSFAYHSIESESATMAGHANTASNAQTVNGHTVNSDVPSNATFTDTTYTFANGTNGFTVTPSGGTAQTVTVTPSITNNVTGSGTSGYLAKFNGANTITNGAQLGSDTTKFLRNDGEWAVPPGAGGGVTGVKGDAESTYRTGNVNLTPANLGLESKTAASGGTDLSLVTTGEKYTWDSKASSDEKVKQTPTSTDADYEILFSESASNLTKTEGARKYSNLKFNPSTGNLQTTKINGVNLTSSPKFTDSKTQLTENTGSWDTRTPAHMNTDAYSICMDSSSIGSGTPQSGVRGCDYSRRIVIHPNSSAISIGCCYSSYSRYLYDAIGFASVAISGGDDEESQYTTSGASGTASISVGTACHANANNTVAIGDHINANGKYEFSFGRYNVSGRSSLPIVDGDYDYDAEGTYVETVGNGTSSTRSNARTLDWSGNEWLAGTLTASGATINGLISVSGSISVSDNILSNDSSLDITTSAPSSDYWSQYGIYFRDTNQTEFGRVRGYYLSDGEVGVEYETKRSVGGTVKYNNLNLGIDSSGNNVVSVSSPSAWRTALGLKDWAEVDHKGGTTPIAIPSGTTEICCVITVGNNTIAWTFTLPYAALSSTSWRYTNAYTSVSDGYIAVNVSTAQVSLNAVYNAKTNVTASSILYLYAR